MVRKIGNYQQSIKLFSIFPLYHSDAAKLLTEKIDNGHEPGPKQISDIDSRQRTL